MTKLLILSFAWILFSCEGKTHKTFNEQLTIAFSNHLKNLDSVASLDSVRILWITPVNQRLGRIIDDTIYMREYYQIRMQLARAEAKNDKDSIAFCRYEIGVLEHNIDSISKSIGQGDTTHRYGTLLSCKYFLKKNNKAIADSTLIYLDSTQVLRYTAYMDSSIAKTTRVNP
jgi:hypothetical protein